MNTVCKKAVSGLSLVLSLSLVACNEDKLVTPDQPVAGASQAVNDVISPNLPKKYTLIKNGEANLTYDSEGRIKRVMYGADIRGNKNFRREYDYSAYPTRISAITYQGDQMILSDTYWLHKGNPDLCYELDQDIHRTTLNQYGSDWDAKVWAITYNEQGQLKTCAEQSHKMNRTDYSYNTDGDLIKATTYAPVTKAGVQQDGVAISELAFTYNQAAPNQISSYITDLKPLMSSWIHLPTPYQSTEGQPIPDPYLLRFGKPSKHLVKSVTQTLTPTNQVLIGTSYTYRLNADGYVTERKEFNDFNGSQIETKSYDYLVTDLGFSIK